MHAEQVQFGKGRLFGLLDEEGAAFQRQFHQLLVLFSADAAALVAAFVLGVGVGQEDFGRRLLDDGREDAAVDRVLRRLGYQNQPAAAFAVGFEDFQHQLFRCRKAQRPPKLFNNAGQEAVFFGHFVHHDVAQVEHIGQHRGGRRIAVFEYVGQIEADAPEIGRIEAVFGVVQAPCEAAVFGFAPLGQPYMQAVGIGQTGDVLQQVAETAHRPVQIHQCVHGILYLLFLCRRQPAFFVLAADADQRVEKLAVGRGVGQLEGIEAGGHARFQCEVAAADGADENLHAPVQIKGEDVGGKAFGKGHQGALQGGFARTGGTQYQGVAGDFFTDVVVFGVGEVEIEVVHGFGDGL